MIVCEIARRSSDCPTGLRPSGKSDDPREFPRTNFFRQPPWTFHCLYQTPGTPPFPYLTPPTTPYTLPVSPPYILPFPPLYTFLHTPLHTALHSYTFIHTLIHTPLLTSLCTPLHTSLPTTLHTILWKHRTSILGFNYQLLVYDTP